MTTPPVPVPSQAWWQQKKWWKRAGGFALLALGFGTTVALAVLGSGNEPLSAAQSAVLVLVGGALQFGGAAVLAKEGRAAPSLAESSVRHLFEAQQMANDFVKAAEHLYEGKMKPSEAQAAAGRLSLAASVIEAAVFHAIADWESFHPDAVARARRNQRRRP